MNLGHGVSAPLKVDDHVDARVEEEDEEGGAADEVSEKQKLLLPVAVGRAPAPLGVLLYHLVNRMTGLLSILRVNTNREPTPIDIALLKAR